ncbi:MAG: hypothetical protein NVSMB17_05910 [Candidatus Dormibacteria bacterium]
MAWDFRRRASDRNGQEEPGPVGAQGTDRGRDDRGSAPGAARLVGPPQLEEAIHGPALRMHFQPLVDLDSSRVVAYEALARFSGHPDVPPDAWFRRAAAFGLREQLELEAMRRGLRALDDLRETLSVCINLSAVGALSEGLANILEAMPLDRVVIELTEHEAISDYAVLNRALLRWRAAGMRLAVDDAGAGFASMRHIVSLQPDIIKLDASWVVDIEADPIRRSMVTALANFSTSIDAIVVAEAVETRLQADVLREIGVPWAQGFFFARPALLQA